MMRATRAARPLRLFLYLAPILLLTALAVAFVVAYVAAFDQGIGWWVFFAIVGFVSASALVVPIVNVLVTITVPSASAASAGLLRGHPGRSPDDGGRSHVAWPRRTLPTCWKRSRYVIWAIAIPTCSSPC
jgi:hypothetical protein